MNRRAIATGVSLHPSVKAYLEEITEDPDSEDFGRTRSHIVNLAIAQYADAKGRTLDLRRAKIGRPKKKQT